MHGLVEMAHIKLQCENNAINEFNMIPDNLQEALFTILLENLSFGNIHRMEIALPAIYNMCQKSKELFLTILKTWDSLSEHAKESLMLCGVRWAREQTEGFEIIVPMLEKYIKIAMCFRLNIYCILCLIFIIKV